VPEEICQQLYAEEQQSLERRQKTTSTPAPSIPPINIVLPASYQNSHFDPLAAKTQSVDMATSGTRLKIPGPRDTAVEEYCAWQKSKVTKPALKEEYQKACDIIIEDGMDLELIHRNPDSKYLIEKGVKRGPAEHIVGDIDEWFQEHKRPREQLE